MLLFIFRMSIFWQFGTPMIMVTDLEIIKQVQTTAFDHFRDPNFIPEDFLAVMGLQLGLIDARGEDWRTLKKLLTPAFSGPRIKKTAAGMNRVAKLLVEHLRNQETAGAEVKIIEDIEKCSMTCIAEVVFGLDVNCFKEPDHIFFKLGKSLFEMWRWMLIIFMPRIMTLLRIPLCNPKSSKHFEKLCHQIVAQRKGLDVERKDIVDNMIQASAENPVMTPDMMFKTLIQFFTDGFVGFSRITCGLVYLITAHPEVQEKLHEEIDDVLGGRDDVIEEDFGNLTYLDQV
jgi:cytochrome P450 family 3 subfamily A